MDFWREKKREKEGWTNRRRGGLGSGFRDIGGRRRGAREVKSGQAEAFDSPTESTGLRTVPTDKPPPPPPCAHGSRGFDADTRRKRLRRVNRNAGHEATDAREKTAITPLLPSTLLSSGRDSLSSYSFDD